MTRLVLLVILLEIACGCCCAHPRPAWQHDDPDTREQERSLAATVPDSARLAGDPSSSIQHDEGW